MDWDWCERCNEKMGVCYYNDAYLCEDCRQDVLEREIDFAEYRMEDR